MLSASFDGPTWEKLLKLYALWQILPDTSKWLSWRCWLGAGSLTNISTKVWRISSRFVAELLKCLICRSWGKNGFGHPPSKIHKANEILWTEPKRSQSQRPVIKSTKRCSNPFKCIKIEFRSAHTHTSMYRRQKQQQWNKNQTEMHSVGGGGKDRERLGHAHTLYAKYLCW